MGIQHVTLHDPGGCSHDGMFAKLHCHVFCQCFCNVALQGGSVVVVRSETDAGVVAFPAYPTPHVGPAFAVWGARCRTCCVFQTHMSHDLVMDVVGSEAITRYEECKPAHSCAA